MSGLWTGWGTPGAEAWAEGMVTGLRDAILERWGGLLEGIWMVGGFGRGEGSVLRTVSGDYSPWNDADLVLVRRESAPIPDGWEVQAVSWAVERSLDSVDLSWVSESDWRARPQSLFHCEARGGHRLIWGSDQLSAQLPARMDEPVALREAHRLLANRGFALLLWALNREVEASPERLSFRLNILAKLDMCVGDSRLLAAGELPVLYRERPAALLRLGAPAEVLALHAEAVEHKLRPTEEWAQERRNADSEIRGAARRWLKHGPLDLAGVPATGYAQYVREELGNWRRRLRHTLGGAPMGLDPRSRLDASLPLLLEGLAEPSLWNPAALGRLWPGEIGASTPWSVAATAVLDPWRSMK